MKRFFLLPLLLIFIVLETPVSEQGSLSLPTQPIIGWITKDQPPQYSIQFSFGIEQWEESKRAERIHQIWDLACAYPSYIRLERGDTYCSLDRTALVRWDIPGVKTAAYVHRYNTEDGTLKPQSVDWKSGRLDFTLIEKDGVRTEVMIRMRYEGDIIFLDSFKGVAVTRGTFSDHLTAVEYRIPEVTYTLQLPFLMQGLKSEGQKRLEELNQADRAQWKKLGEEILSTAFFSLRDERKRRQVLSNYDEIKQGKRKLTWGEKDKLRQTVLKDIREKLERAGISTDGQQKILDFLAELLQ